MTDSRSDEFTERVKSVASLWWIPLIVGALVLQRVGGRPRIPPIGVLYEGILDGLPVARYHLAGSTDRAKEIATQAVDAGVFRDLEGFAAAMHQAMVWDIVLIVAYALALALGSVFFIEMYQSPWMRSRGWTVAAGALAAAFFDIGENTLTWLHLSHQTDWLAEWAAAFAWVKWALLLVAFAYVGFGLVLFVLRRMIAPAGSVIAYRLGLDQDSALGLISQDLPVPNLDKLALRASEVAPRSKPTVGICSSGGGLRSATFSLGAYQALEDGVLENARYLSAVSGGAYMAGGFTTVSQHLFDEERAAANAYAHRSPEETHLRKSSNYLAPTSMAKLGVVGRVLLGLGLNLVFIGSILAVFSVPWGALMSSEYLYPEARRQLVEVEDAAAEIEAHARAIVSIQENERGLGSPELPAASEELARAANELEGASESLGDARFTPARDSAVELAAAARAVKAAIAGFGLTDTAPTAEFLERAKDLVDDAGDVARFAKVLSKPDIPVPGGWAAVILAAGVAAFLGMISVGIRKVNEADRLRPALQRLSILMLAISIALLLTIIVVPWVAALRSDDLIDQSARAFVALQSVGAALLGIGAIRTVVARKPTRVARLAGGFIAPAMAIVAVVLFARVGATTEHLLAWVFVPLALYGTILALGDLNVWSLHPWYRRRLESAFGVTRGSNDTVEPLTVEDGLLSEYRYRRQPYRPELLVCAAVNVNEPGTALVGMNALSFTFSGHCIGIPGIAVAAPDGTNGPAAMVATNRVQRWVARQSREFSLMGSIAISGAAVSPAMGKMTRPSIRALLAIANVRLGVWLPNPMWLNKFIDDTTHDAEVAQKDLKRLQSKRGEAEEAGAPLPASLLDRYYEVRTRTRKRQRERSRNRRWLERVRATYLFKEIFGIYRLSDKFVYVSDGGHWENLGLVELLRRRCTEIYCFDASGDPVERFKTLSEAVATARTEFGIELGGLNPSELEGSPTEATKDSEHPVKRSKKDHTVFEFKYDDGEPGILIYCKPAVTGDSPIDVKEYQEKNPEFPAQTTLDQFFDHEQFEAYRMLGYSAASRAMRAVTAGEAWQQERRAWWERGQLGASPHAP